MLRPGQRFCVTGPNRVTSPRQICDAAPFQVKAVSVRIRLKAAKIGTRLGLPELRQFGVNASSPDDAADTSVEGLSMSHQSCRLHRLQFVGGRSSCGHSLKEPIMFSFNFGSIL